MSEQSSRIHVLALGAHPDDIEAGCGGALIKYARAGHQVFQMVLTEGEEGGASSVRRQEQEAAAKLIGVERVYWGGLHDTEIAVDRALIKQIEQVVREVDPQVIFVHYPDDTHQDHRNLATCVVTAARYTRNVFFYEGPTTQNFSPTVFMDIDQVLEEKLEALCAHRSQIKKTNIEKLTIVDIIRASSHFRGIQGRVTNAEAFVPLRMFVTVNP